MLNVKVTGKLVLGFQHAFVVRIRIWDFVLIIHEVFDSRVKANLSRVIYKLDIEKAHVRVLFLLCCKNEFWL